MGLEPMTGCGSAALLRGATATALMLLLLNHGVDDRAVAQPVICDPAAPLSGAWRRAEGALTEAFLARGDVAGAQLVQKFVWQAAHAPPLSGRWRSAEESLVGAFLARGDIESALGVRGFLLGEMRDAGIPPPTCPGSASGQ
jgi:hypothetical protein